MILKKRAIKAYQSQLSLYPIPKPKPINLPVVETKDQFNSYDRNEPENPYDKWYMTDETPKRRVNPAYARYRNMAIADTVFKVIIGLVLMGIIVNLVFL